MTRSHVGLLLIPAVALGILGLGAARLAKDMSARASSASVVRLMEVGLDHPSKLTPDHVRTVLAAARTIEAVGAKAEIAAAASVEGLGRGCVLLAALDLFLVAMVFRATSRREAEDETRVGNFSPPAD